LFVALLAWFEKAGDSLGSSLTGFILVWIGFSAKLGGQTEHSLGLMKWSYMIFPAAGALLALYFVSRYALTQDQVYSIKAELTRRHATSAGSLVDAAALDIA